MDQLPCLLCAILFITAVEAAASCAAGQVEVIRLHRQRRAIESYGPSHWQRHEYTTEYYGELQVGSPPQLLKVSFDTGSGSLVLPSTSCLASACRNHSLYDASLSETAALLAEAESPAWLASGKRDVVTIIFGTGQVSGEFVKDRVCMGSLCADLRFIAALNETDEPFKAAPFDGILGLALPQLSEAADFSFVDELVKSGCLRQNLFSVYFAPTDEEDSEIMFGAIDERRLLEPITWVGVSNPGFWQVAVEDLTMADEALGLCGPPGSFSECGVAFDTGTSMIAAPRRLARQLAERLSVAPDCSNFESLPELGFRLLGTGHLRLAPSDYVDRNEEGCQLQLMAVDVPRPNGPIFLLGDPFLRKYYTVYDRARLRIGFALAKSEKIASEKEGEDLRKDL